MRLIRDNRDLLEKSEAYWGQARLNADKPDLMRTKPNADKQHLLRTSETYWGQPKSDTLLWLTLAG